MPDFITNCAQEPYEYWNEKYLQADWCVFNPINWNILIIPELTIKIGGVDHITPNPPTCGSHEGCRIWLDPDGDGVNEPFDLIGDGNCTPRLDGRMYCTQGDFHEDDGSDINNDLCFPNACQIQTDCTDENQCGCVEQNGNCDAVALLYQGTVVSIQYINSTIGYNDNTDSKGFEVGIGMHDTAAQFENIFDFEGYTPAGEFIDDIIFYRANTGTHHSLTPESWDYIFNQASWFALMSTRTWTGLANHPLGVLQFPDMDITYPMESLIFEFEEEDTQQTTDIFLTLHEGANLISIPLTTESWNSALNNDSPIPSTIDAIASEGIACTYIDGFGWVGSLTEIQPHRGYWFMADSDISFILSGIMMDSNYLYQLHPGANLISFPSEVNMPVQNAFSDDVLPYIDAVLTEGIAAMQISPGNWVGSLTEFEPFKGYWVVANNNINFIFGNVVSSGLSNKIKRTFTNRNFNIPPIDENGNYQNPHTGIYDWYILDVIEYINLQLSGTITKDTVLNTHKKKIGKAIKTKKPNRNIRRNFGK